MAEPEILLGDEAVGEAAVDAETADANGTVPSPSQQPTSPSDADMEPDLEVFVNNGLKTWQAARESWCRKPIATEDTKISSSNGNNGIHKDGSRRAIELEVDEIIDVLFDPRWRGGGRVKISPVPPRFPINVPLPQMIDILTDLWEAEGLDV